MKPCSPIKNPIKRIYYQIREYWWIKEHYWTVLIIVFCINIYKSICAFIDKFSKHKNQK